MPKNDRTHAAAPPTPARDRGTKLADGEFRKGIDVLPIYPVDMSTVPEMGGLPPAMPASATKEPSTNGAAPATAEA